ncbi:MAG: SPOR domain-containing protein [Zetaproteobacteria bacterium CG12_big_fil_rev_8_21_14_0_65_54_13]|nr:MAG: hypothetical protein COX55_08990 [Zetaproteobacteria bacterium CG23_combo_of_CG06-09_8_20_14_all_54_7]PIW51589.1 MAG: SPOR domain-containing protein [Zetaproteobacteria bacterium CG12_big_fil_rev_8_21_14_0_65_54_13]PIX54939.1 MAG: SPOR domain-containing protein [Zetaproteobacteria bacterium CG_4_10_14_3_um_filter_54_28]PJA27065.1 MAG: SPOR domain-containing protein [Zetaproteobacteria bacterium CG_4_9_14_3_um_filter_54_145]
MNFLPLLIALLVCPLLAAMPAFAALSHQQAYQMLKDGRTTAVRQLPPGEREILMATLALEANHSSEAIELLNSPIVGKDPVAARLRAEAYRRKSIQAANRAGKYAHSVSADIGKLEHAGIELESARLRLQTFIDQVDRASRQPVAAAVAPVVVKPARAVTQPVVVAAAISVKPVLASVRQAVESWVRDWESLDADAYLGHYHAQFSTSEYNLASWSAYKRRVNANKRYIRVGISQLKLIGGPVQIAQGEAVLVSFTQKYESSNYATNSIKRLYLVRDGADQPWLILSEGGRHLSPKLPQSRHVSTQPFAWAINLASFDSKDAAEKMVADIGRSVSQPSFVVATTVAGRMMHRVRVGMYDRQADADDAMQSICVRLGLTDCWLEQVKR